jgi:hypothetical protein
MKKIIWLISLFLLFAVSVTSVSAAPSFDKQDRRASIFKDSFKERQERIERRERTERDDVFAVEGNDENSGSLRGGGVGEIAPIADGFYFLLLIAAGYGVYVYRKRRCCEK